MMPGLKFLLTDSPAKICLIEPQPGLSGVYLQDGQTKNSDGLLASLLSNWHPLGYSLCLREITLRSEREGERERDVTPEKPFLRCQRATPPTG